MPTAKKKAKKAAPAKKAKRVTAKEREAAKKRIADEIAEKAAAPKKAKMVSVKQKDFDAMVAELAELKDQLAWYKQNTRRKRLA